MRQKLSTLNETADMVYQRLSSTIRVCITAYKHIDIWQAVINLNRTQPQCANKFTGSVCRYTSFHTTLRYSGNENVGSIGVVICILASWTGDLGSIPVSDTGSSDSGLKWGSTPTQYNIIAKSVCSKCLNKRKNLSLTLTPPHCPASTYLLNVMGLN